MFFERKLYQDLIEWSKSSNQVLYLEGPRQVGKTELLKKLGREQFSICIHFDLRTNGTSDKLEALLETYTDKFGHAGFSEEKAPIWEAVFKELAPIYTNNEQTLVIFDEIQQSPAIYNSIRDIRRSLKSKLAVSGSYLGIAKQSDEYWEPAGDLYYAELASLSFVEFLKANNIWDKYDLIETFDWAKMTDVEQTTCEQVRNLYRIYCQIGGYPESVREWVRSQNIDSCKNITSNLLRALYRESNAYFGDVVGHGLWSRTLERVASHMVTKTGDLDITVAKDEFRNDDSKGLKIRRKDKVNALKWLEDCKIVGIAQVYDELGRVATPGNKSLFFFRDMGIMSQLCEKSTALLPSDLDGMMSENFVYLHLLDMAEKHFMESDVCSFSGSWGQIDFVMHTKERVRLGIEVKHSRGTTKTGDKALADGKIDYLIKVQDTYGSVSGKQATIPIFMLDKLHLNICFQAL